MTDFRNIRHVPIHTDLLGGQCHSVRRRCAQAEVRIALTAFYDFQPLQGRSSNLCFVAQKG